MADNSKKLSQLPTASNAASTDRLLILRDPAGSPSTRTITVANLANSLPLANTTVAGTIKVGNNLSINATGHLNANVDDSYSVQVVNTASYNVSTTDKILFVNPNDIDANIQVIIPTPNSNNEGSELQIKNINPGADRIVKVITAAGVSSNSNYLEDPITGNFVVYYEVAGKGESQSWISDGTVWRHTNSLRSNPVFYAATNTYHQVVIENDNSGINASGDLVIYNNSGDRNAGTGPFIDVGINSNNYSNALYSIGGPSDAYVFNDGGDLAIGTGSANTDLILHAGGTTANTRKLTINSTAISVNTGTAVIAPQQTKANNDPGVPGQICWDAEYIYVCTSANTWKRATLNTY